MAVNLTRTVFSTCTDAGTAHIKVFSAVEVGIRFHDGNIANKEASDLSA